MLGLGEDRVRSKAVVPRRKIGRTRQYVSCLAIGALALAGCRTTSEALPEPETGPDSEFNDTGRNVVPSTPVSNQSGFALGTVYFDFDQSAITPDAQVVLNSAGQELKSGGSAIVIEGHCDELGSDEYNLALGERRADAVRRYLYNVGVADGQMTIVTYGESRPAVRGQGETAWRLNRRAEINRRR